MNDTISRQQAIDALAEQMPRSFSPDGSHPADNEVFMAQEIYADCIQTLEALPSAQPQRMRGRWVYNSPVTMKCDQCGIVIKDWDWSRFKICPGCGAQMEEGQDE